MGRTVYSTDPARQPCPRCGAFPCECPEQEAPAVAPDRQALVVRIDRKARKGKTVTLIEGFEGPQDELARLGQTLRKRCGCGGSVKEGVVVLQGDVAQRAGEQLVALGYGVRRR